MTTAEKTRAATRFTVLAAPGTAPAALRLLGSAVDLREVRSAGAAEEADSATVLLLSSALMSAGPGALRRLPDHVVLVATDAVGREAGDDSGRLFFSLEEVSGDEAVLRAIRAAAAHSAALLGHARS